MRPLSGRTRKTFPYLILEACLGLLLLTSQAGSQTAPARSGGNFTEMVLIAAGKFTMGRDGGPANESPAHTVHLPAFRIDRNLVTLGALARFLNTHGLRGPRGEKYFDDDDSDARIHFRGGRWRSDTGFARHPAAEVSLPGAAAYCRSIGRRLPSEAEWEKAARGADGRLYPWGGAKPGPEVVHSAEYHGDTAPVGRFPKGASPYGVLDMGASLAEWTRSAHRPYPYRPNDGRENPVTKIDRVLRGGVVLFRPGSRTATFRGVMSPRGQLAGHAFIGFRCAKDG